MDRTETADTPYEVDSNTDLSSPPMFTKEAANNAQQVVSLKEVTRYEKVRRAWAFLGLDSQWRIVVLVILFALAGGVAGGLLAAARSGEEEPAVELLVLDAGVNAKTESDAPLTRPRTIRAKTPEWDVANLRDLGAADSAEYEDEDKALQRMAAEIRNRRSDWRRQAYLVDEIRSDGRHADESGKSRRVGKRGYWDGDEPE